MRLLLWLVLGGMFSFEAAAMPLIQTDQVTRTASTSGDWSNPSTWNGGLPDSNDIVRIPNDVVVTVDGANTNILHLRVDGVLRFDPDLDSSMTVDTLEVTATGVLEIGTVHQPVAAGANIRIRFRSDSPIDVGWDADLLSRGLLADGRVRIHGHRKTAHVKVAVDPLAGDTSLELASTPEGWAVGDRLVLTGTRYSGWKWDNDIQATRYFGTQDEVRTITAIDGALVTLDAPLAHDHLSPRADLKASVANFARNVTFETVDGETVPLHYRAHVMLRHHTDFDVRFAAFEQLGRTDKSVTSFDLDQLASIESDSNVRGRYALHFHMTGIDDPENPAMAVGNAVFHSPGWGFVHHASNAVFHDNASFDTHGAGFVAETGDEIGSWTRNIAIRAEGNSAFNPKNGNDPSTFDMGRTGDGFWFQGRMVRAVGNIAASVNHGYVYLHRGTRMRGFENDAFMLPEALRWADNASPDDAPILNFHANESFASTVGLYVVKANPNQQHDIHSHLSSFTAWEVRAGAALEYTSHYLLEDFDIIGKTPEPFSSALFGIEFGTNTTDMVINRATIADVPTGIRLGKDFTNPVPPPEANQYVVIDAEFIDVDEDYEDLDLSIDQLMTGDELVPGRMSIQLDGGLPLEYLSPSTTAGSGIEFLGEKLDSVGFSPIPAGTDNLGVPSYDMIAIVSEDGYYRAGNGDPYAIVEEYFTDRSTGTIHKYGLPVLLGPDVEDLLGNQFHAWRDAFERGPINLDSQPPIALDDQAFTTIDTPVIIQVLANDSDPDGDPLGIDGVVQPNHGLVIDNGDGSLTYRPDFDFQGTDRFTYWASDDQGNFTPARVTVEIDSDFVFRDDFEN